MIDTAPSIRKNAINTSVSENAPVSGEPSSIPPTTMPSTADSSDHQKPGAWRIQKLVTSPTMPLTRNSQPNRIVTAKVAIGGRTTAVAPRTRSTTPSTKKSTQCSWNAAAAAR